VELILPARFAASAVLHGARLDRTPDGKARASGGAELRLGRLEVRATESILVAWLPDHDSFFLLARDVELFRREKGFRHATERASLVSIADEQVTILP